MQRLFFSDRSVSGILESRDLTNGKSIIPLMVLSHCTPFLKTLSHFKKLICRILRKKYVALFGKTLSHFQKKLCRTFRENYVAPFSWIRQ
jgi:hypothetical protein